jgi:hypothetical protein
MVADVAKQLVANLRRMIRSKAKLKYVVHIPELDARFIPSPFRLVNSAAVEAQEIYDKLLHEEKSYRLALFPSTLPSCKSDVPAAPTVKDRMTNGRPQGRLQVRTHGSRTQPSP